MLDSVCRNMAHSKHTPAFPGFFPRVGAVLTIPSRPRPLLLCAVRVFCRGLQTHRDQRGHPVETQVSGGYGQGGGQAADRGSAHEGQRHPQQGE